MDFHDGEIPWSIERLVSGLGSVSWCERWDSKKPSLECVRQIEITEAIRTAKRIQRSNEIEFGPIVGKVMEIRSPVRRSFAANRTVPNIESFQALCVCPNCGSLDYHWLAPISRLTRIREDGQLKSKTTQLVNRYCRNSLCEYSWIQN